MRLATLSLLGLLAAPLALVGCGGGDDYKAAKPGQEVEHEEEVGPHGGDIFHAEPHDPIHLEMTFDEAKKLVTLYVVEEKAGKFTDHPVANDAIEFHYVPEGGDDEATLTFDAVREAGATDTAKFQLPAEKLPATFTHEEDVVGHVHLPIGSKSLKFDIVHGHGHDHGHEHGHDHGTKGEDDGETPPKPE